MKKNHITRDSIIVGLALFSTMFGAGNLIFPPQIGLADGTKPRSRGSATNLP